MLPARRSLARLLLWPCVVAGASALLLTAYGLPAGRADARLLLFSLVALSLGTRVVVKVPRVRACVPFAEGFCVLAFFVFGAEASVLLGSFTSFCAALRLTRESRSLLLSASTAAVSLFAASWAVRLAVGV